MIFNLANEKEQLKFKDYCNKLYKEGCAVELTKKRLNRTLSQNSYLHLLLSFFGCEYGCSIDEVKIDFFKRTCNKEIFERTIINKKGQEVTYLRSSSELDTAEMALAITRFRNWAVSEAGIYLPAAHENEFLFHVQREIQNCKEYI